jgi:hypothetical protein
VLWESSATIEHVLVEFSADNGKTWFGVFPPNVGNSGQYQWLIPLVAGDQCLVRVSNEDQPSVYDTSDQPFVIQLYGLQADLNGDGVVDLRDMVAMASQWLEDQNLLDPAWL